MRETHRFLRGMVAWVGYAQIAIPYERAARVAGKSKYPLHKMLAFAWTAANSYAILPLRIIMTLGALVTLFGAEEAIRAILAHIFHWYTVRGWTELMKSFQDRDHADQHWNSRQYPVNSTNKPRAPTVLVARPSTLGWRGPNPPVNRSAEASIDEPDSRSTTIY
jgi:hypothetical protein